MKAKKPRFSLGTRRCGQYGAKCAKNERGNLSMSLFGASSFAITEARTVAVFPPLNDMLKFSGLLHVLQVTVLESLSPRLWAAIASPALLPLPSSHQSTVLHLFGLDSFRLWSLAESRTSRNNWDKPPQPSEWMAVLQLPPQALAQRSLDRSHIQN